jgi:hypothetical protein
VDSPPIAGLFVLSVLKGSVGCWGSLYVPTRAWGARLLSALWIELCSLNSRGFVILNIADKILVEQQFLWRLARKFSAHELL